MTPTQSSLFDPPDMPATPPAPEKPPEPSPLPVVARDRRSIEILEDYVAGVR